MTAVGCADHDPTDVHEELGLSLEVAKGTLHEHQAAQGDQADPAQYAAEDQAYIAAMKQHMDGMGGMMDTMMACHSGSNFAGAAQAMMDDIENMMDEIDRHADALAAATTMAEHHEEEAKHVAAMEALFEHMAQTNQSMMGASGMPMCAMGGGMMY